MLIFVAVVFCCCFFGAGVCVCKVHGFVRMRVFLLLLFAAGAVVLVDVVSDAVVAVPCMCLLFAVVVARRCYCCVFAVVFASTFACFYSCCLLLLACVA